MGWLEQARGLHGRDQEPFLLLEIAHAELGLHRQQHRSVLDRLEQLLTQQDGRTGDDWDWLALLRGAAYLELGQLERALEALPTSLQRPSSRALELGIRLHAHASLTLPPF